MINTSIKYLKVFLASRFRKIGFFVALIFDTCVKFLDLLLLDKFRTILVALALLLSTILLSSTLNIFRANFSKDLVVFNRKISDAAILLKL